MIDLVCWYLGTKMCVCVQFSKVVVRSSRILVYIAQ